jgi:hypothetical protein
LQTLPVRNSRRVTRAAKSAIIEKARTGYLLLSCGCYTTYEEQLVIEVFFTKRPKNKWWCEKHGNWQEKFKMPKVTFPEKPPF